MQQAAMMLEIECQPHPLSLSLTLTIDGRRALLGSDAFRDRYVVFPKSAMICVACYNLIALWHSSFICIFGALPDVCCTASSIGSTAVSHIALHVIRIHAYMES